MAIKTGPPGQGAVLGGGVGHWFISSWSSIPFQESILTGSISLRGDNGAQKEVVIGPYHMEKIGKWDLRQGGLFPWSSLPCPRGPSIS